jgi:hypothetical protein
MAKNNYAKQGSGQNLSNSSNLSSSNLSDISNLSSKRSAYNGKSTCYKNDKCGSGKCQTSFDDSIKS